MTNVLTKKKVTGQRYRREWIDVNRSRIANTSFNRTLCDCNTMELIDNDILHSHMRNRWGRQCSSTAQQQTVGTFEQAACSHMPRSLSPASRVRFQAFLLQLQRFMHTWVCPL